MTFDDPYLDKKAQLYVEGYVANWKAAKRLEAQKTVQKVSGKSGVIYHISL